jgi:hypothetical protein
MTPDGVAQQTFRVQARIEEGDVDVPSGDDGERVGECRGSLDVVALGRERLAQGTPAQGIVDREKNGSHDAHSLIKPKRD